MEDNSNFRLLEVYKHFNESYRKDVAGGKIDGDKVAQPYFLSLQAKQDKEVVTVELFGLETHGWGHELGGNPTPEALMELYDSFVNQQWGGNELWWQYYSEIREFCRDSLNGEARVVANNLSKVGRAYTCGTGTDENVFDAVLLRENLLQREQEVIMPDIIVLATTKYDDRIRKVFGQFETYPIYCDGARISRLHFKEHENILCYQHPYPTRLSTEKSWEPTLAFLKCIIEEKLAVKKHEHDGKA